MVKNNKKASLLQNLALAAAVIVPGAATKAQATNESSDTTTTNTVATENVREAVASEDSYGAPVVQVSMPNGSKHILSRGVLAVNDGESKKAYEARVKLVNTFMQEQGYGGCLSVRDDSKALNLYLAGRLEADATYVDNYTKDPTLQAFGLTRSAGKAIKKIEAAGQEVESSSSGPKVRFSASLLFGAGGPFHSYWGGPHRGGAGHIGFGLTVGNGYVDPVVVAPAVIAPAPVIIAAPPPREPLLNPYAPGGRGRGNSGPLLNPYAPGRGGGNSGPLLNPYAPGGRGRGGR